MSVFSLLSLLLFIIQIQISDLSLKRRSCQLEEQRFLMAALGMQNLLPQLSVVELLYFTAP